MHDRVDFVLRKDFFDLCPDAEIDSAEDGFGRDGGGVALLEIIEGDDLITTGKENLRTDTADVARGSGYKNVQGSDLVFLWRMCGALAYILKLSGWHDVVSGELVEDWEKARIVERKRGSRRRHTALESEENQVGASANAEFA
jgi:hypothetical protein